MPIPDGGESLAIYAFVFLIQYPECERQTDGFAITESHSACLGMLRCDNKNTEHNNRTDRVENIMHN